MALNKFWTSGSGNQIQYCDLSDDHFMNIIADGYRNKYILREARYRGIDIPPRRVDLMDPAELDKAAWALIDRLVKINGYNLHERKRMKKKLDGFKTYDYDTYLFFISRAIDGRDNSVGDMLCIA